MMMNSYAVHRIREEEKKDLLRQVDRWRLLRDAGLLPETVIKRSTCRLLCQLGRALVALGEQLEQYGEPRLAAR